MVPTCYSASTDLLVSSKVHCLIGSIALFHQARSAQIGNPEPWFFTFQSASMSPSFCPWTNICGVCLRSNALRGFSLTELGSEQNLYFQPCSSISGLRPIVQFASKANCCHLGQAQQIINQLLLIISLDCNFTC